MTPETQQIAIAEACGWTGIFLNGQILRGYHKNHQKDFACLVPDYLNDLNAMHEAEKVLTPQQRALYAKTVARMPLCDREGNTEWEDVFDEALHSTAAQRSEAFLKTLNLWKD